MSDLPCLVLRQLFDPASSTYTYLVADPESREAVIIDPVFEQFSRDAALIGELGFRLIATLDTHCHADHVTGAWLFRQSRGCRIGMSSAARGVIDGPDLWLEHGDQIALGARHLEVRHTPGHTDGCMTLVSDDRRLAFTGDCLLIRGAGRCDFQQGNAHTMYRSITEQIFSLPADCMLYPGHDYAGRTVSSVAEERAFNPRIGGQANERDFVGFMENLNLPHPKQIDIAVPANLKAGKPYSDVIQPTVDWGPVRQNHAGLFEIDATWVAEQRSLVHILDVRDPDEWRDSLGHIDGAQNIPLGELKSRITEIPQARPVVTVCHSGMRSGQAMVMLRAAGVRNVANLRGGMLLWNELGLPVVRGR